MKTVLIVIGIILGILVIAGAILLMFDMWYYRKIEKEEEKNKNTEEDQPEL